MSEPVTPLTLDLLPLADAITRQSLILSGLWRICDYCSGDGKVEQSNPHRPLVECPICRGQGGHPKPRQTSEGEP